MSTTTQQQGFRLAGVMGWPVGHSRSPRLHGYWLNRHGIRGAYVPMPVRPENLEQALRALPVLGFAGCNLTVPLKERALSILDEVDAEARRIGSVNTVIVRPDGRLFGQSTDGYGFVENLKDRAPQWRPGSAPVALLGAGGSARAIAAALHQAGETEIRIINRTRARAEALAGELGGPLVACEWAERQAAIRDCHLLVNTTTQGMVGEAPLDLVPAGLAPGAIVADIVYVPLETALLAAARAAGCHPVDGLGMLLHQARPGFEAWFGVAPVVDAGLREAVLAP
jgi:shikimate dehydrogenase